MTPNDYPTIFFSDAKKWRSWLIKNHNKSDGVWLKISKKAANVKSITRAEALDEALCFGWIDSQSKSLDDESFIQKYTPRRKRSIWSKVNIVHTARLIKDKKMRPSGLKQIELAKADGRWAAAYDSPSNSSIPLDFLKELKKNKKAYTFFKTLNKTNLYSISWRLQTAKKPETRAKRGKAIIRMLADSQKFHP
ncbi:MAG: YdeI/OmpD-associated family protein [Bdellovibrionota bacterium]